MSSEPNGNTNSMRVNESKTKTAGVEHFMVRWQKHANAGPTNERFRIDFFAKFKKDAKHDPILADFRQNVMSEYEITDGPHKGEAFSSRPLHDDDYSRADDVFGNSISDLEFISNDNLGISGLHEDDDLNYRFTAEQMIIDISQNSKIIAKLGPYSVTISGKHPRTYSGIPKTLEWQSSSDNA